ncbi:MAG TPA: isoamylase early set domain-containing protein [Vicinamibacterales bacterium]
MENRETEMTGPERLIQRFIDQELSGEERIDLLVRIGRDHTLREQLIDLEQLLVKVDRLARPAVPEGFVASVMDRTAPETKTFVVRRATEALWMPRVLRWNLAGAMVAACVTLLVAAGVVTRVLPGLPDTPGAVTPPAPIASPVLVRLVVLQPGARTVEVAGDFNGWDPTRTPLEQLSSGAWTVTLPLVPGRYEYMFVVDGKEWIADPFALEQNDDGFGSRNAVLDVRPSIESSL